ncbi:MAG: 50S ribosomal protein L11 methyltransferase [Polyangiaceae bacterium]|nr:50S ribosomal protein L11 methyltransferase [Polyangiaceae bacterium]
MTRYPFVHLDVLPEDVDEMSSLLFDLGANGVEERDETTLEKNAKAGKITLVASFDTQREAEIAIDQIASSMSPRYQEVVGDGWRDAWKEHFKPYALARGLIVRPPWETYEAQAGDKVLVLEPGRAFGTGLHETTRLVAQAMQQHESDLAGATVLDVGCGSGVLALAALALGAKRAICIDIDQEAVHVTRENAARNAFEDRVEASTTPIERVSLVSPVVLANIEAHVLIPMAAQLKKHVAPGGLLLLSGVLVTQRSDVLSAYADMDLVADPSAGEWILLALRKR